MPVTRPERTGRGTCSRSTESCREFDCSASNPLLLTRASCKEERALTKKMAGEQVGSPALGMRQQRYFKPAVKITGSFALLFRAISISRLVMRTCCPMTLPLTQTSDRK